MGTWVPLPPFPTFSRGIRRWEEPQERPVHSSSTVRWNEVQWSFGKWEISGVFFSHVGSFLGCGVAMPENTCWKIALVLHAPPGVCSCVTLFFLYPLRYPVPPDRMHQEEYFTSVVFSPKSIISVCTKENSWQIQSEGLATGHLTALSSKVSRSWKTRKDQNLSQIKVTMETWWLRNQNKLRGLVSSVVPMMIS